MLGFWAVAWNGFLEARRNKVTMVLAAFAVVMLFSTSLVSDMTVSTIDRVITDFGLGTMAMMLAPLAIYLSCGVIPREIERRTIFLIVTRPLSRSAFLAARIVGNMITLGVLLLAMVAVFGLELGLTKTPVTQPMVMAVVGLYFELLVITAAGMLFSAMSSQLVSAIITVGLYFAGHLSTDLYQLAKHSESRALSLLGQAVYYAIPNLERLNFRPMATYGVRVEPGELASGLGLAVAYAVAFGFGAAIVFERRDFK